MYNLLFRLSGGRLNMKHVAAIIAALGVALATGASWCVGASDNR